MGGWQLHSFSDHVTTKAKLFPRPLIIEDEVVNGSWQNSLVILVASRFMLILHHAIQVVVQLFHLAMDSPEDWGEFIHIAFPQTSHSPTVAY
jgi:hypothetical protein